MKHIINITLLVFFFVFSSQSGAEDIDLQNFLSHFDYSVRKDMKIKSETLVEGLRNGDIQLIDIRFKEEFDAWHMGVAVNIPLNELPGRLGELQKNKLLVTACPHKDRAILGMVYLRTRGFHAKYLQDGLIGLAEYLRGDQAKDFMTAMDQK